MHTRLDQKPPCQPVEDPNICVKKQISRRSQKDEVASWGIPRVPRRNFKGRAKDLGSHEFGHDCCVVCSEDS